MINCEDRVRMERAHVLAWPALRTVDIEGWLWRSSGGGSQRANSVSTIDFHGAGAEAAVLRVESCYRALGQAARFHTFEETYPAGMEDLLRRRGYRESESTITMFKRVEGRDAVAGIEVRGDAWAGWRNVYLGGITENRRAVNSLILHRIQAPRAFFGLARGGETIATALCVVGFGCAVIECVATRPDARRQGAARCVLEAVERWAGGQSADWLGLQVVASNAAAVGLYKRLGFFVSAVNRFWVEGLPDINCRKSHAPDDAPDD